MRPDYIFISGVSRTGSSLVVRILNRSPEIAISDENWFLGHQIPWEGIRHTIKRRVGDLSGKYDAQELVEFLYSGEFKRNNVGYWFWLRKKIPKEDLLQKLIIRSNLNDRILFASMMEICGEWAQQKKDKTSAKLVLGEKTPSHIYYVPTLLEWYPNSKVIHTFRDPRGIFASELRRRKSQPYSFPYKQLQFTGPLFNFFILLQVTYTWFRAAKLHLSYKKLYPNKYFLLRFEDLVSDPERHINLLCNFLDLPFQEAMLQQKVVSNGYKSGQPGFDKHAANRWKNVNSPWVNKWFLLFGRKYLKAFGFY